MKKDNIQSIIRHILNVQQNCLFVGQYLIDHGEFDIGKELIAHGFIHDNSKFFGIEFEQLQTDNPDKEFLTLAIYHHSHINPHHPEYWGGIKNMPEVYLAEMACDVKARSNEFGTSVKEWIDTVATKKYNFKIGDKIYKKFMKYINILCDQPFKDIGK